MSGKIYVWQDGTWLLPFMYDPVMLTLKKLIPLMYNNRVIEFKITGNNMDDLLYGDTLIWVGMSPPNFEELKKKNIYTIHYDLEPFTSNSGADEIWTYSRYMFEEYKKVFNKTVKYIPVLLDQTVPTINYSEKNTQIKLTFIGDISTHNRIKRKEIINASGVEINDIFSLWSNQDFNMFIINKTDIFLNILKDNTKALASVRINKLLSHKCIIISEHTNDLDEELYKDMVFFKDLNEIGDFFKILANKSKAELEIIAENSYQKFIKVFNIENVFNLIQTRDSVIPLQLSYR
jgi:hypothetical protein